MPTQRKIFEITAEGSTWLVVVQGNISNLAGGEVQPEVTELVNRVDREHNNVVMDLEEVDFFGSEMLAAMQTVWKRVRSLGGAMVLSNVGKLGREILQIAKFDQIWPMYASREEALAAVAGK